MSDTIVHSPGPDRNRTIASLVAALVIHVAVLLVISIFARLDMAGAAQTPTIIDVQLQGGPGGESAGPITPGGGSPAAPAAAAAPPAAAAGLPSASSSGGGGGYVIPTPSGRSTESSAVPTGPSFQTGGARTGVAESLPPVQSSEPQPTVTVGQKGKTTGAGPTSGSGSTQRSGQGVLVTGSTGKTGSDSLDLSQLDKAMTGSGTGSRGSAAGGGSGTASSGSRTGTGGTGSGGTGTGSGGAGGGAGAGGAGSGGYSVEWDQPDASKGRILLNHPGPKIPAWVSAQGLTLSVRVAFTLLPDGVVSTVSVQNSTGYADVDSSVVDAIRHWRFSAAKGGGAVKGVIPYIIKTR